MRPPVSMSDWSEALNVWVLGAFGSWFCKEDAIISFTNAVPFKSYDQSSAFYTVEMVTTLVVPGCCLHAHCDLESACPFHPLLHAAVESFES